MYYRCFSIKEMLESVFRFSENSPDSRIVYISGVFDNNLEMNSIRQRVCFNISEESEVLKSGFGYMVSYVNEGGVEASRAYVFYDEDYGKLPGDDFMVEFFSSKSNCQRICDKGFLMSYLLSSGCSFHHGVLLSEGDLSSGGVLRFSCIENMLLSMSAYTRACRLKKSEVTIKVLDGCLLPERSQITKDSIKAGSAGEVGFGYQVICNKEDNNSVSMLFFFGLGDFERSSEVCRKFFLSVNHRMCLCNKGGVGE